MEEIRIGKVTHYFGRIGVAVVSLTDPLKVGDVVRFKGRNTDFSQRVESMQVEHKALSQAKPGDVVAIQVTGRVHEGDVVYKIVG